MLTVPLDWSEPDGETMPLRVYRQKSTASESRGTIINFPSGPGESGDIGFASLREQMPDYDLVAIDPRGVGDSGELSCPASNVLDIPLVPPTDEKEFAALRADQEALWSACSTDPAAIASHADAVSNARDAEAFRAALGVDRVNVYGFSYGTLYAERYLGMFGRHVNGSILEGVMNPAQSRREFVTTAAASSQALFERFAKTCGSDDGCVLHDKDIPAVLQAAKRQARDGKVPGTSYGRPWSDAAVSRYMDSAMTSDVRKAAADLLELSRGRNPISDEGPDGQLPARVPYADLLVCSDFDMSVRTVEQARLDHAAMRRAAPDMGYSANSAQYTSICLGGPQPADGSMAPVASRSPVPTLLLSNSHDPSTPVAWANSVEHQLGAGTYHIRTDRAGHGGALEEPAVVQQVTDYMDTVNPRRPEG
ncbi:alpha/beta fold hydrolase [Pseudonocardia phyllosphaerae]|uniref:alpha/beta fold hydrolase n=1 Tax=Pseudonocardia phyllosphaerae TaxID=3390502 RepID=UPI00397854FE